MWSLRCPCAERPFLGSAALVYNRFALRRLGKYRLLAPIASGGMAEVWLAEVAGPAGFVKRVALKLVRADRGDDPEMVRMFIQEANLASRLHHANIVHVFAFERVEERYVIAMELVHGKSLRSVLDRCRETGMRLGLPRSVHVAAEVARALAYAHRPVEEGGVAGLVHRDVSPQNVLVSFEGEVKLADFGIARAGDAAGLTSPGTMKGKAGYMPPEQWGGGPVDGRVDVFALGVVLWEMCAGRRLFARDSEPATLKAVEEAPVSPPSEWNEEVPPDLDALVLAALERDAARRTGSAAEMARGLAEIRLRLARTPDDQDLRPLMHRLWPLEEMRQDALPPEPGEEGHGTEASTRRRSSSAPSRALLYGAGAAVVALAAAAPWWWLRRAPPVPPAAAVRTVEGAGGSAEEGRGLPRPAPAPAPPGEGTQAAPLAVGAAPPAAESTAPRAPLRRRPVDPGVLSESDRLGGLTVPDPASGEGILFVNTVPWAEVAVDGQVAGDTPREMRLRAGSHRLRLSHPTLGAVDQTVLVRAGERVRVEPALQR